MAAHVVVTATAGTNPTEKEAAFVEQTFALLFNLPGDHIPKAGTSWCTRLIPTHEAMKL